MDFTGIFQGLSMNYATGKQTASFELNEDAREAFQDLKGCEKLTIQIKKYRKKRSLDANAYYWVLVSKLGKVLDMANPEVHNIALIRYGQPWIIDGKSVFTTIPDTEDAENQVRYAVNYHLQPTSQVREGNDNVMYRTYRLLRGSHTYNTEEMATAYADTPVKKSKEEYTRARWQIDAHGYWRSSGDRLISKEELKDISVDNLQAVYRKYSRESVYSYEEHVKLAEELDKNGKLPASFMVVAPGSWNQMEVWDDINRMRTLNTTQSRRRLQMHVCPLQLDIVERIIDRFSNPGETVLDPFGGLMTVPMTAVKMNRKGYGIELSPDYFRDGVGYLQEAENERETPTLFDFIEGGEHGSNS